MPDLPEPGYDCPACLGARLEKWRPVPGRTFVLDRCGRCGGMWFDRDEVHELRRLRPDKAWRRKVVEGGGRDYLPCHSCHAPMPTHAADCPSCGWHRELDCPSCGDVLVSRASQGVEVDVCEHCRGAWFDHPALRQIWVLPLAVLGTAASQAAAVQSTTSQFEPAYFDAVDLGLHAAAAVADGAPAVTGAALESGARLVGEAIVHTPGVAATAFEATGNLAGAVFDVIAEIFGSVFS